MEVARRRCRHVSKLCLLLCVAVWVGCDPNPAGRLALGGKVSFKGKPLARGTIEFTSPDPAQITGAPIREGSFSIPAISGLRPGAYDVRVFAAQEARMEQVNDAPGPEAERQIANEVIPPQFNIHSQEKIHVEAGKPNSFDIVIP